MWKVTQDIFITLTLTYKSSDVNAKLSSLNDLHFASYPYSKICLLQPLRIFQLSHNVYISVLLPKLIQYTCTKIIYIMI